MKVHSKDHDYYDTANTWQSDVHWQRPETTFESFNQGMNRYTWFRREQLGLKDDDRLFVVGFCGSLYYGIQRENNTYEYTDKFKFDIVNTHKLFDKTPIFVILEYRWSTSKLYISPILKDWGFYKVKDAFTAHQEIEQYLTNELASQQDGLQIAETEAQVLQRHGMDKCSFKGKHSGRKVSR